MDRKINLLRRCNNSFAFGLRFIAVRKWLEILRNKKINRRNNEFTKRIKENKFLLERKMGRWAKLLYDLIFN